ncbi:hypothetical protein AEA09_11665 [Lysinibacillus contaminans]|uniref:DUF4097 domain-containing protein n=1 Tax=Lysinibacillus contaminans TaxID=1293441 RepID=A0ABR5K2G7_9BACI|nr:DUF4097 family beta strand repeat-containing protein [Lysinibacillus contaminans]KOS69137.1 hypothetical protein AEA09_11665 [Lysinibacillus contaminans]
MTSLKQIAGSMIVVGIVLAMIGFASGGKWFILISDAGFHVPNDQSLGANSYELDAFTNINLSNKHADIEILPSDNYGLELNSFETSNVTYAVKDGTLTVDAKSTKDNGITIGFRSFKTPTITIYVPKDALLSNIELDSSFGDINLEQLNYQQLNLFVSHGDISFENIVAGHTEITQSFGDMALQQFSGERFIVESEHGDIDIDGELNGESTITSSFGDVDLDLLNKESELGLDLNTNFGDITLNNKSIEGDFSQSYVGDNQLKVSITHGDLELSLK